VTFSQHDYQLIRGLSPSQIREVTRLVRSVNSGRQTDARNLLSQRPEIPAPALNAITRLIRHITAVRLARNSPTDSIAVNIRGLPRAELRSHLKTAGTVQCSSQNHS
jgi:hypothetical protein